MKADQTFAWPLTQERIETLANELYLLQDVAHRINPGGARGERAHALLNDLRAHVVAAGAEDPFPYMEYAPAFPDTPKPEWPDPKYLRFEDEVAA